MARKIESALFDENATILRHIAADGGDLSQPRNINFAHVFPDPEAATGFAEAAAREGFSTALTESIEHDLPWEVTASLEMTPSCDNITEAEEFLDDLANRYAGRRNGWAFASL